MTQKQPSSQKAASKFIQAAKDFEKSEIERVRKNIKIAWRITCACLLIMGLSIGAIAGLTPLKTVTPFVIRVDNNTGATDIVTQLKTAEKSYGEVINKYWLAQYVGYRESYDWQTVQSTYNATNLLSAPPVQSEFAKLYNKNPAAPHLVLKDQFKVIVKVSAISFIGEMAQVRFEKHLIPLANGVTKPAPQKMIATVAFEYQNKPLQETDRLINPLGFQVTSYRVDPEATP